MPAFGVELPEYIFDFGRVIRAQLRSIRDQDWRSHVEAVAIDRVLAGFALRLDPGPR